MGTLNFKKYLFEICFALIFIITYLLLVFYYYILHNNFIVSPILFIGFSVVIAGFFFFINIDHKRGNYTVIEIKFPSGTIIKMILIIIMSISFFIPPITSTYTIILWEKVNFLNYVRAYSFLFGCAFVPGGNLYNIFFCI